MLFDFDLFNLEFIETLYNTYIYCKRICWNPNESEHSIRIQGKYLSNYGLARSVHLSALVLCRERKTTTLHLNSEPPHF